MKRFVLVTLSAILALFSVSSTASAQTTSCDPASTAPLFLPVTGTLTDIRVDDACQYVYALNSTQNRIEVLSLQTRALLTPIQVGSRPTGFDITPDGTRMYVANSGGNNISVVDLMQRVELRKITVPAGFSNDTPYSIAIASNGLAFFSTTFSGTGFGGRMMQLNLATEEVSKRTDYWFSGSTTERTKLRASGDHGVIGIVVDFDGVFNYTAATNTFSPEKPLSGNIYDISVSQAGSKFLVTPGGFVLDGNLNLNGTVSLETGLGGNAIDSAGLIGYRTIASRIDVLNLATFLKVGELSLPEAISSSYNGGRIDVSRDGRLLVVVTEHGIALVPKEPSAIAAISPESAPQSTTLNVAVTGESTHFVQGQTTASFGAGIVVHGITVSDATHASVHITIPSGTAPGPRTVVMTTGAESKTSLNGFIVTPGAAITHLAPNRGQPGQQNLTVEITAAAAHFEPGVTSSAFGPGITVTETRVISANRVLVRLAIASDAVPGQRSVLLTTGNQLVSLANGFTVRRLPAPAQPVAYMVGRRVDASGTQYVTVVNTATNAVTAVIPVGNGCTCAPGSNGIAVAPDGASIYVANEISKSVSVIDAVTNAVAVSFSTGASGPTALTVSPDGTRLYVLLGNSSTSLKIVDTSTFAEVATVPLVAGEARGMAMTPDGRRLYVSSYGNNVVQVVDTETRSVISTIQVGVQPMGVDVSPDGAVVYVSNSFEWTSSRVPGTVSIISTATNSVVGVIPVGYVPSMTKFSPDGTRAYVTNKVSPQTWVIDTASRTVTGTVAGSTVSYAAAFTPDGSRAYVSNDTSLLVVDTAANSVIGSIPAPTATGLIMSMAMSPGTTRAVVMAGDLDFGAIPVGTSATRLLTITNNGNAPLAVNSLTLPAGFRVAFGATTIAAGDSQQVAVTFMPVRAGTHGGMVMVGANQTAGRTTIAISGYGATDTTRRGDFDRDGVTDVAIYRPSSGSWFVLRSSSAFTAGAVYSWGAATDLPMPGDYDADGQVDVAVYRPSSGHWFILTSSSNYAASLTYQWGTIGDLPMAGDFDGDGRADLAIYRPSSGAWYMLLSGSGYVTGLGYVWGAAGDVPVPYDYDGDGRTDIAVYRPSSGHWFILQSSSGYTTSATYQSGTTGDVPVPGDYDGDNRGDLAVYSPSTGSWSIPRSSSGFTATWLSTWGVSGDSPVPSDYDGDGRTDIAVYRPSSGHWFILKSSTGYRTSTTYQWGTTGDVPVVRRP